MPEEGSAATRLRAAAPAACGGRKEAVLVDAALDDRQVLSGGAPVGSEVVEFGGAHDGLAQLVRWSATGEGYDALHLLCHGGPGRLQLGARELDRATLADPEVRDALAAIGLAVRAGGSVLLYGCHVAQGDEGAAFVTELELALGVPVAASTGAVGAATLGGEWRLTHADGAAAAGALAWPAYAHTLTIASNTTNFSGIVGTPYYKQQLAGYDPSTVILTQDDVASTGWDVEAKSTTSASSFGIRGYNTAGYGADDTTSLRFLASDIDYVIFRSNAKGFYFDLTQFSLRNNDNASFQVQALDADGNAKGSAVLFSLTGTPLNGGAFSQFSLAGNVDFQQIYGFKLTFDTLKDAPFFDNVMIENIVVPGAGPTTTVNSATLSHDTGSSTTDFITKTSAQTISGTLSANLASGEKVEVSYDNGANWSEATTYAVGSNSWSTDTTLSGSGTFQARVTSNGGSSTAYAHSYTVDTSVSAPAALDLAGPSDSAAVGDHITRDTTPTITGTAEEGSTVTLYGSDGSTVLGTAVATGGTWSITPSVELGDGNYGLTARALDVAGNGSDASIALGLTIDSTAPSGVTLSSTSVATTAAGSGATVATLSSTDATAVTYALAEGIDGIDANNASFTVAGNTLKVGGAGLNAGTYRVYLSATDAAGNVSYLPQTIRVLDAPSVTSIVRADGVSDGVAASASSVRYTVTFSDNVSGVDADDFTLATTGNAGGHIAAVSGSGNTYTVTVDGLLGDGTLRLDLNAGGTGIQSGDGVAIAGGYTGGQAYTLDHTAPAAPFALDLASASDSNISNDDITRDTTPTITGRAEEGSTVTLYDSNGNAVGSDVATGGLWSITPSSALGDAVHQLTARAVDAAGNESGASMQLTVTIDSTAPSGVTLSSTSVATAAAGSGATVATLSSTDATAVTYALAEGIDGIDANNASFTVAGNTLKVGGAGLNAGTYHVYLSATDAAGNVSYLPQTITVLDAPSVTSIVRADGVSDGVAASASSVRYTVTFSDNVSGVDADDFTLATTGNAGGHIAAVSGSGNTYTVTVDGLLGDGTLRLDLNAGGTGIQNGDGVAIAGGYTGGHAYTLDHTAPAAPSRPDLLAASDTGIDDDNVTRDTTPAFSGTAEVGSIVTLFDSDGSTVLGTDVATDGTWTIEASELTAGTHGLTVKAADAAGNLSNASHPLTVTIDTSAAAPAAPTLAAASDSGASNSDRITNVVRPTVKGTAEAYAAITVFDTDGTTVLGTATADAAGAWELVSATLNHGIHTLKAQQVDAAGNQSLLGAGLTLTIDTQAPGAPGVPMLDAASDSGTVGDKVTNIARPVIRGTAEANALVRLYDTDGTTLLGTATADAQGDWSLTSSALSAGAHTLTAVQVDLAGNVSPASAALALTIEAPPAPPAPTTPTTPTTPTSVTVDGVVVSTRPVTLPGGGTGTQVVIPVVTPGRVESTGNAMVADIPLATNAGGALLAAQIPVGFGLTASGGASLPAGSSLEQLIRSIVAATPGHSATDQSHLTGNGTEFLGLLDDSLSLLVQTIVPTAPAQVAAPLVLTGTSNAGQHTALVIDTTGLPSGSQLVLNAVDFAAVIGAVSVTGNTTGQILTGDAAGQAFTVAAGTGGMVFSGGGADRLAFESTAPAPGSATGSVSAAAVPAATVLHGGFDGDAAVFNGKRADYVIEQHDGYLVVTHSGQPKQHVLVVNVENLQFADTTIAVENRAELSTIAGLYRDALGRQADYQGFDFWGTAQKNGASLGQIALGMLASQEAQDLHGWTFTGHAQHDIEVLYQGIFGRDSDAAGLAFWTDAMAHGVTLEQVAQAFVESAEAEAHLIGATGWDFQV